MTMSWPPTGAPAAQLPDPRLVGREYRKTATVWAVQMPSPFICETREGTMRGAVGDYLCQGPAGECWPVARAIFEATYEAIA